MDFHVLQLEFAAYLPDPLRQGSTRRGAVAFVIVPWIRLVCSTLAVTAKVILRDHKNAVNTGWL
jgi:hypothetical protein